MEDMLIPAIFMGVMILAGFGLLYLGWYERTGVFRKLPIAVEAECIESRVTRKHSIIKYRAWVNGEERVFRDDQQGGWHFYAPKTGETVTLRVDPDSGRCALPERGKSVSKATSFLGGCFIAGGIMGLLGILGVFG